MVSPDTVAEKYSRVNSHVICFCNNHSKDTASRIRERRNNKFSGTSNNLQLYEGYKASLSLD